MRPNPQLGQLAVLGIQKVGLSPLGLGNLYDGQQKAGRLAQVWLKLSLCCPSAEECWALWERCAQRLLFHPQLKLTQIECSEAVWQKDWNGVVLPVKLVTQTYTFYEREPTTCTAEDVRVDMLARALGDTAAGIDGMVTEHRETLTERNGAAVLELTIHAEEQIGIEAVDDSVIPEENAEMEQVP